MPDAPHVLRDALTRGEIGIIVAWVRSGFALDDGAEERKPYARRILAKLRGMWAAAGPDDVGPDAPPLSYSVPPGQTPEINRATAELWGSMDPPSDDLADVPWREYAGALAACDVAMRMGARYVSIVGDAKSGFVVQIIPADAIGSAWVEVWRPPERKRGSPSRWK